MGMKFALLVGSIVGAVVLSQAQTSRPTNLAGAEFPCNYNQPGPNVTTATFLETVNDVTFLTEGTTGDAKYGLPKYATSIRACRLIPTFTCTIVHVRSPPYFQSVQSNPTPVLCLHSLRGVRVCITKRPTGIVIEGVNLKRLIPGECYDFSPSVAEYLVLNGYAIIEMRSDQRIHKAHKPERRRHPR